MALNRPPKVIFPLEWQYVSHMLAKKYFVYHNHSNMRHKVFCDYLVSHKPKCRKYSKNIYLSKRLSRTARIISPLWQ